MKPEYNGYVITIVILSILLLSLLIFSYLSIRKVFLEKQFNNNLLNQNLSLIMLVSIIISVLTILTSYYNIKTPIGNGSVGGNVIVHTSTNYFYLNILNIFNFKLGKYIFRIASIVLLVISGYLLIKGYKNNNHKQMLISLGIGLISNLIIGMDYYIKSGEIVGYFSYKVTFVGVFSLLIALGIGIYQIIYKNKHGQ